ncbi:TonB-dependent receptor plug domain-containing protein [Pelagicoccus sp. SDUM812005]|uniref:TonB-dependent receptor plug domain-containing protein n=1 Tax=Pelagicoccus sp. SDUM812005 TaxID=3041257 RepID=UPI00280DB6CE|nr:TonB-dependent receptor plug domain-containing protein [Pelagicoccus sp. SDUM812005]MDQ8180291.1 TonB-dependent receptor plug domain-containing protein [Pelagicoccus sp. SDUM812005]
MLAFPLLGSLFLQAQDGEKEEEVFELSPFEVDGSQDQGYRAENTLAGSRLNMSLEDVAQSVNVLTMEFLEDVGAENIDDILLYAVNAEPDHGDAPTGLATEENVGTTLNFVANGLQNIRGSSASVTVDNNNGGGTIDTYNASRVEISQGPNAVLFGFGGAGGAVNLSTQRASMQRDSFRIQSTVGSDDQFRNIFNFNKVLIDGKLGFKVISLFEDKESWRAGAYNDSRRNTFVLSARPFEGTEFSANYERGHIDKQWTVNQGATDAWQAWDAVWDSEEYEALYGAGTFEAFNRAGVNRNSLGSYGLIRGNNSQRKVFIDNLDFAAEGLPTDAGNIIPLHNFSRTSSSVAGRMLSDEEVDISQFTPFGPDSYENQDVKNLKVTLNQRIRPNLFLNLEYFDSDNDIFRTAPTSRNLAIQADPNKVFDGVAAGAPHFDDMVNPFGPSEDGYYLYSEMQIQQPNFFLSDTTLRGSIGYLLDTERWGDHRINIAANKMQKSWARSTSQEILDVHEAIARGVNLGRYNLVGNNALHANNTIWRRHYYAAGPDGYPVDDSEIKPGSFFDPVEMLVEDGDGNPFLLGTKQFRLGGGHQRETVTDTEGTSFTWVGRWWKDKVISTVGLRNTDAITNVFDGRTANSQVVKDEDGNVVYNADGSIALLDEAARPFLYIDPNTGLPGANAMSESFQSSTPTDTKESTAANSTFGLVYKPTNWMSVVYNRSTNRSDPSIYRVIIPGIVAPSGDGFGQDIGLRFNLFDRKVSLALNYFENRTEDSSTGGGVEENLLEPHRAVLDAFVRAQEGVIYYLQDEEGDYLLDENNNPIVDDSRTNLPMAQSDPRYLSEEERLASYAVGANQTLIDKESAGYDVRIVANPSKNWRLAFNFSDMLRSSRKGLYDEDLVWLAGEKEAVMARYEAYAAAGDSYLDDLKTALRNIEDEKNESFVLEEVRVAINELIEAGDSEGAEALFASLHPIGRAYDYIGQETGVTKLQVEDIDTGSSAKKANMFTSYRFREGKFKGFTVGGGFTWRDKRTLNHFFNYVDDETGETTVRTRPDVVYGDYDSITIYESDDDFRLNLMGSYSTKLKLFGIDANAKFQVNVDNVLQDGYSFEPLRYLIDGNVRRYTIVGPRTWKLTTTIDF